MAMKFMGYREGITRSEAFSVFMGGTDILPCDLRSLPSCRRQAHVSAPEPTMRAPGCALGWAGITPPLKTLSFGLAEEVDDALKLPRQYLCASKLREYFGETVKPVRADFIAVLGCCTM